VAQTSKKNSATKEPSKESIAKAKYYAAKAAKRAARSVSRGTVPNENATTQNSNAVATKPKRARYARKMKPVQRRPTVSILPPRRTSFHARLMSKGITLPPKEERGTGLKLLG
jgi:hypothetical protein